MTFSGFPSGTRYTSVPNPLLGPLLEEIQDLAELKVVLRGIWLLQRHRGWPRMISQSEFLADRTLTRAFKGSDGEHGKAVVDGLRLAVDRGIFLVHEPSSGHEPGEVYYLLNSDSDRRALSKMAGSTSGRSEVGISGADVPETDRPNIFVLYEDNIGMISPMLAEELKEAEELYPWAWLAEAFKIAVTQNRRSWNYVVAILRRWSAEGKTVSRGAGQEEGREDGKPGRHSEAGDRQKHIEDYQRRRRQIRDQPTKR